MSEAPADEMSVFSWHYDKFMPVYHKKTGKLYVALGVIINATNACDGQKMVLYANEHGMTFVREYEEFWEKFERYTGERSREEEV